MKLQFKNSGSTAQFVSWLRGFQNIQTTVLLEIDLQREMFVAKAFPITKTVVKYSSISFEAAGFELFGIFDKDDNKVDWADYAEQTKDGRVKVGIYSILPKVIEVFKMFTEVDHEMIVNFDLCTDVVYVTTKESNKVPVSEFQTNSIMVKSKTLAMKIGCSQISEFFYECNDETFFNRVCNIGSPSSYVVSMDAIGNLMKIASIFCKDKANDKIRLYSKKEGDTTALYAYDDTYGAFDYLLGYFAEGEDGHTETYVYVQRFENTMKSINAETVKITLDTAGASRVLIDTQDSKIMLSAAQGVIGQRNQGM